MNRIKYIVPMLMFVLLMNSCITSTHTSKRNRFIPDVDVVRLDLNLNDFEIVGETEINVLYHKYFGIITVIDEVNGVRYDPYNTYKTRISGVSFGPFSQLGNATTKIIDELPNADYYHVVYDKKKREPLLFGKVVKETALIRGYNIKYNKNSK